MWPQQDPVTFLSSGLPPVGGTHCIPSSLGSWKGASLDGTVQGEKSCLVTCQAHPKAVREEAGPDLPDRPSFIPGTALQLSVQTQ